MKKKLEDMTYDELMHVAQLRHGFAPDEVKSLYPTQDKLLEFLKESNKGRGLLPTPTAEEAQIGWDSEDDTPLDDDGIQAVSRRRQAKQAALSRSLAATNAVTAADVKNVKSILADLDSEDEEDDNEAEDEEKPVPKPKKKAKKKTAKKK